MKDMPRIGDHIKVRGLVRVEGVDLGGVWLSVTNVLTYRAPRAAAGSRRRRARRGTTDEWMLLPDQYVVMREVTS